MTVRLDGVDEVLSNLNREIEGIKSRSMAGLYEAGLLIQRASQQRLKNSVISGNLRASAYTRAAGRFDRLDPQNLNREAVFPDPSDVLPPTHVEIGFTAVYAPFVHENTEGREPKFLEGVLRDNQAKIVEVVRRRAELDG